jgi:putative MATE family efflux protein
MDAPVTESAQVDGRAKSSGRNLTQGPITQTLLLFTLPALLSSVLQTLNGSINGIWVGRLLGEAALAATANAHLVMFLLTSVVFGLGMATTVIIGQCFGRRDILAARRAFGASISLCLLLGLITLVLGWWQAETILRMLATPADVYPFAHDYLRIIFLSTPAMLLLTMIMMALRGAGDATTPLRFMIVAVVLDAGLNPFFILGLGPLPAMGISGAAMATVIANIVGVVALIAYLYWRDLPLRLRGAEWHFLRPNLTELRLIISQGIPMGLQMIVISLAMLIVIGLVNREGMFTIAAYGAAQQLWNYVQMPAMAVGGAVSAMAAQNIGAGRWERVDRITRAGVLINLAMTGALLALVLLLDRQALALFLGAGSPAIEIGRHMQLIAGWSFLLFAVSMVLTATMRANGVVIGPLLVMIVALFPVRFGFYFAAYGWLGVDALWFSFVLGSAASLLMTWTIYRYGGWRKQRMAIPRG